jgi:hypothetical protein
MKPALMQGANTLGGASEFAPVGISLRETRHMSLICRKIKQLINDINEDINEHVSKDCTGPAIRPDR